MGQDWVPQNQMAYVIVPMTISWVENHLPKNGRYVFLATEPCPAWSFFAGTSAESVAPRRPAGRCLCKLWQSLPG